MSRWLYAAVIEDDKGQHHQFHAFSEPELNKLVADWTRARWREDFGKCPEDDEACIEIYFDWQSTNAGMGFAHEIWSLDPIELESDSPPDDGSYQQPQESFVTAAENPHTYPMEIFVNGELSFKLDSEDAEGDLKAIRALMEIRTRKRQNKPLTNRELYGVDDPHVMTHTDAQGRRLSVKQGESGQVHLLPSSADVEAARMLEALRAGRSPATSSLEALDEVLLALTPEEAATVQVASTKGPMTVEMAKRLRFERGFDIRPKSSACPNPAEPQS